MKVIFTDLDGSLLDHNTYSFEPAREALGRIKELNIPLILCSSKTKSELYSIRHRLHDIDPFVVENGGAVYIPKGYKHFEYEYTREEGHYHVLEMGANRKRLREIFLSVRDDLGLHIRSLSDMSLSEVVELTLLSEKNARRAMERFYTEPFVLSGRDRGRENEIMVEFEKRGYRVLKGGRFYHLMGNRDKGDAVRIVTRIFTVNTGKKIFSIGLGDSQNDISMLRAVDRPVLIRRWDGNWLDAPGTEGFARTKSIGPSAWNEAVLGFLGE